MQKKIIVIGGGFAGLTAAAYLAKNNFKVTLLEASPKLGGRAYSFVDKETDTTIDNGQHILMGCYHDTLNFLKLIGALKNFTFQKRLEVNFVKEGFQILPLKSFPLFYPFNLLFGLMNYHAIKFKDRLSLLKVFLKLPFYSYEIIPNLNIEEWLESENQSQAALDAFWKILAVGALNTSIEKASAKIFIDILREIFFNGSKASIIVLPKFGLSESYVKSAQEYISQNGGDINTSEPVERIIFKNSRITKIKTDKKVYSDFDFVVSAVPSFALAKIFNDEFKIELPEFGYSTILNIHIWLKQNTFPDGFFGLINSLLHWVFNRGTHLNIVISDANNYANMAEEEIIDIVKSEMKKFFVLEPESISSYKIIKEKRATFVPSKQTIGNRPSQKTKIENLVLAGDWVDTGLPSTIESAVKSGRVAVEMILGQD